MHRRQDAHRLALRRHALVQVADRVLHLGMAGIAEMPQRGGQVRRTDEHAVHASTEAISSTASMPGRLSICSSTQMLSLMVCRYGHRAVAVAALRAGHAAHALRRIARGRHGAARIGLGLDEGDQQVVEADIQHPLDLDRVIPRRPPHRRAGAGLQRLQLLQEHRHLVGRVLAVEQQPVEIGQPGQLGRDVAGHAHPESDEPLARQDALAETVGQG